MKNDQRAFPLGVAQRTVSSQGLSIGGYNGVMRVVMQINTIIGHNEKFRMEYIQSHYRKGFPFRCSALPLGLHRRIGSFPFARFALLMRDGFVRDGFEKRPLVPRRQIPFLK